MIGDEFSELDEIEPEPRVKYKPGHRINEKVDTAGPSPWERPRDGFTAAMAARSDLASNTREGRRVTSRVNW